MDPPPVVVRLDQAASGLRHLRWAREIAGSLAGHLDHGALDDPARALVRRCADELGSAISALSAAVKAYRDFLERRRTLFRGAARAGRYWGKDLEPPLADLDGVERAPLRGAVRREVAALHRVLAGVDAALGPLGAAWVASLYPPLAGDRVAGDGDGDDDAAGW